MTTPVSGGGNRNHSVDHSSRSNRGQHGTRAATPEESQNIQSRPGSSAEWNSIPAGARQQAIANAQATGSSVVEVWVNGELLFFPLNAVQGSHQNQMEGWAVPPGPDEEEYMSGGYQQVWSEGEGPQVPYSGGAMRGNMTGGMGGGSMRMGFAGPGYGGDYGGDYAYGGMSQNEFMWDTMVGGQQREELYAQRRNLRNAEHQMKVKMRLIMFLILMGDVVGAVRAMVFESERQNRMFNRLLVSQLNKVRESKSKILLAMARKRPPTAHDNTNNPGGAARDQNAQAKYTQWVSVTTQLMSEVQNTERQIMDLMSEGRRTINESWEAYSGMKEAEARTTRTVLQSFRG